MAPFRGPRAWAGLATFLVAAVATFSSARDASAESRVSVPVALTRPWTRTGLFLLRGQSVKVTASGTLNWFTGACDGRCISTPAGIPCPAAPEAGATCFALLAKIGDSGETIAVGDRRAWTADRSGELFLGLQDNNFRDNTGAWIAEVSSAASFGRFPGHRPPKGATTPPLSPAEIAASPPAEVMPGEYYATTGNRYWEGVTTHAIRVSVEGNRLSAVRLVVGSARYPAQAREDGPPFLVGTYESNPFLVRVRLPALGVKAVGAEATVPLKILTPDHLQLGDAVYTRYSDSRQGDLPCNPRNPFHVLGSAAHARGLAALRANDFETANCWFYLGAAQGDPEAQRDFATSLHDGRGVDKDDRAAFEWYSKAAQQGDFRAQYAFSLMFRSGLGCEKDEVKADYWLRVASHSPDAPVAMQNAQSMRDAAAIWHAITDGGNDSPLCNGYFGDSEVARQQRARLISSGRIKCGEGLDKAIRGY
jgi:hypothetical protein